MAVGLFGALYVLWCAHWRHGSATSPAAASAARGGGAGRGSAAAASSGRWSVGLWARREAARLGVLLLVLLLAAWPWGVAVSRFRDNRHNVSDVVAGLLLGACFAPLFFGRLLVQRRDWDALLAAEEAHAAEQQQQGGGGACGAAGGALGCSASGAPATSHGPVLPIVAPGHISSSNGGRHAVV
jgi:membrane-associated phospholipid phosphatase